MADQRKQAEPPPRDESALLERVRELEETNAALQREVHDGRLLELALRESEQRLQDLTLTTADWLWETDAQGRFTACSDRVTDVLGYTPEEIIGRSPFDLMLEEDIASVAPVFERMLREKTGCSELKNRNRHKDGHEVVLLTSCVPALDEAGELLGFRGVDKDITRRERMERSLFRQTRELEALLEAGRAIAGSIDYDDVLRRMARAAGEALGAAECVIWEYSPNAEVAIFRSLWEREPVPGVSESLAGTSYEVRSHAGGLDGLRAGVVVQQSRSDPDLPAFDAQDMDRWGEKTWLTVPLVLERELLGIMVLVETESERLFDADEVRMAGAIGEQAAVALHNALRHRREERQNRWLRTLVRAARVISESQDPNAALEEVAQLAAEALQSPAAFLYEYAADRDALVTRARWVSGSIRREDPIGSVWDLAETPEDRRALQGELFIETVSDPALPANVRELMRHWGEQTLLNVPLRSRNEVLGMLVLIEDQAERVYSDEELEFMRAFGDQVALALTTARSATTDGLTGLANHRTFYERLRQELARGRRYDTPVSLLMIDIDDFKVLNDTYGHPAGDEALRRLGRLLREHLRQDIDVSARYGGEEFTVILPNTAPCRAADTPVGCAEALAERLRETIAAHPFMLLDGGVPVRLTVSVGVASFPEMAGDMDELVARADAALYAAKRAGKNRVEVYWRRQTAAPPGPDA